MSNPTTLVPKFWNDCNILRDDGLSYCDHLDGEQTGYVKTITGALSDGLKDQVWK